MMKLKRSCSPGALRPLPGRVAPSALFAPIATPNPSQSAVRPVGGALEHVAAVFSHTGHRCGAQSGTSALLLPSTHVRRGAGAINSEHAEHPQSTMSRAQGAAVPYLRCVSCYVLRVRDCRAAIAPSHPPGKIRRARGSLPRSPIRPGHCP